MKINMKIEDKDIKRVVPPLRFPEFRGAEGWGEESVEAVLDNQSSQIALKNIEFIQKGYPVYGADRLVGLTHDYLLSKDYISIVKDGAGVGRLMLRKGKSSILSTLNSLTSKDETTYKLNWLYYLMQTINLSSYVKGSGIPHIYYADYKKHLIYVPKPAEQTKIANCLSSLDDLISAITDKIETLKEYKKGLMQQLFPAEGKTTPALRFPEFQNAGEWKNTTLGAIGDPMMCKRILKEQTTSEIIGNIPFYKIGTFGGVPDAYIPKYIFDDYRQRYPYPNKGDILISAAGTIGRLVIFDGKPAYFQDSNIVWIGNTETKILNIFLYYVYQTLKWQTSDGGIVSRLYNNDLKNMIIFFPSDQDEQLQIVNCLSSVDKLISSETDKLDQLKTHKKGLMQQLFPTINK